MLQLLSQFHQYHPQIRIKAIVADALYGQADFMDAASDLFDGTQVISQLRQNQNIQVRQREQSLTTYFATHPGVEQAIQIRGQSPIRATVGSLRVKVCAHSGKKRFVRLYRINYSRMGPGEFGQENATTFNPIVEFARPDR